MKTIFEKLFDKCQLDEVTNCWNWTGAKDKDGYGKTRWGYYRTYAHRLSYMLLIGEITKPCVCHRCDNPCCVNPDHLFLGTHTDNAKDKSIKGRNIIGVDHHNAKLNPSKAKTIRYLHHEKGYTKYKLSKMFNVGWTTIDNIIREITWRKHV